MDRATWRLDDLSHFDVVVVGGGPAGLAAAIAAHDEGASVALIERERRMGGILKQCVHDGFGTIEFGTHLTGPEYAQRFLDELARRNIAAFTRTFVLEANRGCGFSLTVQNSDGIGTIRSHSLVLATGCRERSSRQVSIHGQRPSGIYTAGTAQYLVNIQGLLPCRKCVILGSGDVGLIMARRLTLEGAQVLGVYEAKPEPTGLIRNISQCLNDFSIPLHLSHTVTRVFGGNRVESVEISKVDADMKPIVGTEQIVECDAVIVAVGLIPENELAEALGARIHPRTRGPEVTQGFETSIDGLYACGNCVHVHDLVDYVTQTGRIAGRSAARRSLAGGGQDGQSRRAMNDMVRIAFSSDFAYTVPQWIDLSNTSGELPIYFRPSHPAERVAVRVTQDGAELAHRNFAIVRPEQMELVTVSIEGKSLGQNCPVLLSMTRR